MATGKAAAGRAAARVDEARLWQRHMDMARIGATPKGGNNRQALGPEDAEARSLFVAWGRELGFDCETDPLGNIFVRRPGTDRDAPPVMTGSHLDTQPTGGRFDGIYGCLAGIEVLQAAEEAGVETRRPLEAVVWTNEEGSRFMPGCLGSTGFAQPARLGELLAIEDADGITVGAALADTLKRMPKLGARPLGIPVHAFVEIHIEQGPILEAAGKVIGVVTGIQGARRYRVEVTGEDAHSGTTPRSRRKDAFFAALDVIGALRPAFYDSEDVIRFTIGRMVVEPGSPFVVPGRVVFSIDFRHPDLATLERLGSRIEGICRANAGPCAVRVEEIVRVKPTKFEGLVPETAHAAVERLGYPYMHILSGAGHDAQNLAPLCPTGMIFVPCEGGRSHNEIENAKPSDLAAGARVLAETMVEIANR